MKNVVLTVIDTQKESVQSIKVQEPVIEGSEFVNAVSRFVPVDSLINKESKECITANGQSCTITTALVEDTSKVVIALIF